MSKSKNGVSTLHIYFPRSSQTQLDLVVKLGRHKSSSRALQLLVEREARRLKRKFPEGC